MVDCISCGMESTSGSIEARICYRSIYHDSWESKEYFLHREAIWTSDNRLLMITWLRILVNYIVPRRTGVLFLTY